MSREFRLTRSAWAHVILADECGLAFEGLDRRPPDQSPYVARPPATAHNCLVETLLHDNTYMERRHEEEVASIIAANDYLEDWVEHVEFQVHREGACPHGSLEDRAAYAVARRKMLANGDARWQYESERIDWEWLKEGVINQFTDWFDGIMALLEKHPVNAVWQQSNMEWIDIGDVLAFCPDCGEPIAELWDDYDVPVEHTWQQHTGLYSPSPCMLCEGSESLGEYMGCLYDLQGNLRPLFCCPDCGFQFTTDDLDGTLPEHYGRPATWPRDAPYPPRRGFLGESMDVVPWET